jgi:UDP-N-acetylglucosamine 2-epimerase
VLAATKLGIPVAHVEAGLRSFDRRMPEELNRIVADHLARWCFAPTPIAVANLAAEGIRDGVCLVGDLMQDLAAAVLPEVRDPAILEPLGRRSGLSFRPGGYLFATIHRAENREPAAMQAWSALLEAVAAPDRPVVLALHPGTRVALEAAGLRLDADVRVVEPQPYRSTLALQLHAAAELTDSGGVQRESAWLGVPCLVLRERTEWTEAVAGSAGTMVLVGRDMAAAQAALERLAPAGQAAAAAKARAIEAMITPVGAVDAIADALGPVAPGSGRPI